MEVQKLKLLLGEDAEGVSDAELANQFDLLKSICSIVVEDYVKERSKV